MYRPRLPYFIQICLFLAVVNAQEGQKFLIAIPPTYWTDSSGNCEILITTDNNAEVFISFYDFTDHISVDTGSYIYDIDCTQRATVGHSNKAFILQSDVDISVQLRSDRGSLGDVYLVLPYKDHGAEYILGEPGEPCGEFPNESVFTIAADFDNTVVELYAPVPGGYFLIDTITLEGRFATYTDRSSTDYTGWKLSSSSPISVITGSSCYKVNVGSCLQFHAGYVFAPPTDEAGYHFIVPQITKENPGDSGSYIRVISFSQSNLIELPDLSIQRNLNSGEFIQHHIPSWITTATRVQCREQCIVILYNEIPCGNGEGGFLMHVTPLERRKTFAQFTALEQISSDSSFTSYVAVISETQNIVLDGDAITEWNEIQEWPYYETVLEIDHGRHDLQSTDGGMFVAFLYGHTPNNFRGYGLAVAHDPSNEHPAPFDSYV